MLSVTELLARAAEYDRLAAQASRPKEKAQNENLAACYRYLAEETEKLALSAGSEQASAPAALTILAPERIRAS